MLPLQARPPKQCRRTTPIVWHLLSPEEELLPRGIGLRTEPSPRCAQVSTRKHHSGPPRPVSPESWCNMLLAVAVVLTLWLIAGVLVVMSTRKPSDVIDLVLASPHQQDAVTVTRWNTDTVETLAA